MQMVQRACVIAFVGLLVGGVHAMFAKPILLKPVEIIQPFPEIPDATKPAQTGTPESTSRQSQAGGQPIGSTTQSAPQPRKLGLEITLQDALDLQKIGAVFIDARHRPEYEQGHIAGAFLLPADMFDAGRPDALNYIDQNAFLIIYCSGGECDASHNTAKMLQQAGFMKTHILKEGYPAWKDGGHPIATGKPDYE